VLIESAERGFAPGLNGMMRKKMTESAGPVFAGILRLTETNGCGYTLTQLAGRA
jgi:hypothetical protein